MTDFNINIHFNQVMRRLFELRPINLTQKFFFLNTKAWANRSRSTFVYKLQKKCTENGFKAKLSGGLLQKRNAHLIQARKINKLDLKSIWSFFKKTNSEIEQVKFCQ